MTGKTHSESINPATGQSIGEVPLNTAKEIKDAVGRIREAQKVWAELSFQERGTYLRRMQRHLAKHGEDYARVTSQDNGKNVKDAYLTEITAAIIAFDY